MKESILFESGEMYLETIFCLIRKGGQVRSVDIVEALDFSKSSVSRGVHILEEKGMIAISEDGYISFTNAGRERAQRIFDRHQILTAYLVGLGVSQEVAEADACRMEHVISQETLEAIKKSMK